MYGWLFPRLSGQSSSKILFHEDFLDDFVLLPLFHVAYQVYQLLGCDSLDFRILGLRDLSCRVFLFGLAALNLARLIWEISAQVALLLAFETLLLLV